MVVVCVCVIMIMLYVPLFNHCLCVFLIWAHMSLLLHNSQTGFWSHFFKMRHVFPWPAHVHPHIRVHWPKEILDVEAYPNTHTCACTSRAVESVGSANVNKQPNPQLLYQTQ